MAISVSVIPPASAAVDVFTIGKGDKGDPGVVWRGAYVPNMPYAAGDGVTDDGNSYVCLAAVDGTVAPGDDESHWQLIAAKGGAASAWADVAGKPTTIEGFGITDAASTNTQVAAQEGLTGGGDLSENFAIGVDFGTGHSQVPRGDHGHDFGTLTGIPDTLKGYGIVDAASSSVQVLAGDGLAGGGDLTTSMTLRVVFGTDETSVCAGNDPRLNDLRIPLSHDHDWGEITSGVPTTLAGYGITDGVINTRQVIAGTGLTGGGALSADRTLAVSFGTSTGTVCQGDDSRLNDARTPVAHNQAWSTITATPTTLAGYGITDGVLTSDDRFGVLYGPTTVDQTLIGIAYTAVTGLQATLAANTTYFFDFLVVADADATTTGIDIAVNGPATPTYLYYVQTFWSNATTVVNRPATAYNADTANAGSPGTAKAIYRVAGIIRTGAAGGSFGPTIKRENVGTGPNVRAGSWGRVTKLA